MRLALAFLVAAAFAAPASASCGDQEAVLRDIKLRIWPGLYRAQDVDGLQRFLVPGFRSVDADGRVTTRADEVRWLAANPWRPHDFTYTITSIDCPAPGLAVIIGSGRSVRTDVDGRRRISSYISSNLLVRDGSQWRAAASHISGARSE